MWSNFWKPRNENYPLCFLAFHLFISHSQLVCGFFWHEITEAPNAACSIAEQSMRLQSFAQWILPIPIQPFRDPGPSRISKLRLPPGAFLPSFLSLYFFLPTYLSSVFFFFFFSRYEPRLKKRGSIGKSRLDWKIEARLKNGGSIGKSRLDCVIEPRLSQSGKTRYRGRFRSRVFGLVYQKP